MSCMARCEIRMAMLCDVFGTLSAAQRLRPQVNPLPGDSRSLGAGGPIKALILCPTD
jgi:hypothetical protein